MKDFCIKWLGKIVWSLFLVFVTFYFSSLKIAFEAPQKAEAWFDKNFDRRAGPYIAKRKEQFRNIHGRLESIDRKLDVLIMRTK